MAKSQYEYTRELELDETCGSDKYIVIRIDGQNFHRFASVHQYNKPNDTYGLQLMNYCALSLMKLYSDIIISYGISDEYSFVLHKSTQLYQRRKNKLSSIFASNFTATFNYMYDKLCTNESSRMRLQYPQAFDGRCIEYTDSELRDYLCYRQCDIHINNTYLYLYHACVCDGMNQQQAELLCKQLNSAEKQQYLLQHYNIDYKSIPAIYRLGSIGIWQYVDNDSSIYTNKLNTVQQLKSQQSDDVKISLPRLKRQLVILHESIFPAADTNHDFFTRHQYIIPYVSHNDYVKMQKKQIKKLRYSHNHNMNDGIDQHATLSHHNTNQSDISPHTNGDYHIIDLNQSITNTVSSKLNKSGYKFDDTEQSVDVLEQSILHDINQHRPTTTTSHNTTTPLPSTDLQSLNNLDSTNQHIYCLTTTLSLESININTLLCSAECGAVSSFAGFTRQNPTHKKQILCLDYTCYEKLVHKQIQQLVSACIHKYPSIYKLLYIHKLGRVYCNECSILIGISSPHRIDSLSAVQYLIEHTKLFLSIFKQEVYVDDTAEWITNKEYDKHVILQAQKDLQQ